MNPSSQSIDTNKLQSYLSMSSAKFKPTTISSHPIVSSIQKMMTLQQHRFQQLSKGCSQLQLYITSIQSLMDRLQEKLSQLSQSQSAQTIFNLKNKQNQFIIHELKDKIKKLQSNEQSHLIEIKHLKKQLDLVKRKGDQSTIEKQQHQKQTIEKYQQSIKLKQEQLAKMKQQLGDMSRITTSKDTEIQQLNKRMKKLMAQQQHTVLHSNKQEKQSSSISENIHKIRKQKEEDYKILQSKLLQLEKEFQSKVTKLHEQVKDKNIMIKDLQQEITKIKGQMGEKDRVIEFMKINNNNVDLEQNASLTTTFNPSVHKQSITSSSPSTYQLQLKLTHQQALYKQLEQQYTAHLTTANNLEIQLHQQIHSQKTQLQQEKKKHKLQKKQYLQSLQSLATQINKRTFNYFDNNIENVIAEIKKIFTKEKQKWDKEITEGKKIEDEQNIKITELQKDLRKFKTQNNLLKQQVQSLKQQIQKLQAQREREKKSKRQNASQFTESNQTKKSSLNGSLGEISNPKSETLSLVEEKYKSLIQCLRVQIEQKQQHIAELQNLQTIDFQKSKEKILAIESQLADSRNQTKKQQRLINDLKQKIAQNLKQIQKLKSNLQQTKQKHSREKESTQNQHQQKIKTLEQKIIKLKDQNQQIDSKCQQKVMKYNKLKTKLEKLQMYNNQTQKRKDTQIEDLIKKNQQIRMQCKLLQEKLNIAQTLQLTTSGNEPDDKNNNAKTTLGYNRDLIEQIQMERDRILQQYENKRRQHLKLREVNEKLQDEKKVLQGKLLRNEEEKLKIVQEKEKLQRERQNMKEESQRILTKLSEEKNALSGQVFDARKQLVRIKDENEALSKQVSKLQQQSANKSKQEYQYLKKQLQAQLQLKKKKEKQEQALVSRIKELKEQNQKMKKDFQQKNKLNEVKLTEKLKEKSATYHQEVSKIKEECNRKVKDLQQKLSEAAIREENLVNIINYKNLTVSGTVRESMRIQGEENPNQHKGEKRNEEITEQLLEDDVEHVEEYDFMLKHSRGIGKVDTVDQETQTKSKIQSFEIFQFQHINIVPDQEKQEEIKVSIKQYTLQRLQPLTIAPQRKQLIDQQSNVNIFDNDQELLNHIKSKYPSVVGKILDLQQVKVQIERKKRQEIDKNPNPNIAKTIKQKIETVDCAINTQPQYQPQKSRKRSDNFILTNSPGGILESINEKDDTLNILKSTLKNSQFFLQNQLLPQNASKDLSRSSVQPTPIRDSDQISSKVHSPKQRKFDPETNKIQQINLFENLKPVGSNMEIDDANLDDNFQICEQGESINVGQTALNLQIKEIFNKLRQELQKVFNGQDISLSMIKILPRQLEDDYNEFIGYVKQKIQDIKNENQLSFIMAEVGDSPQQIQDQLDLQLQNFVDKKITEDIFAYKKLVQEKQALITSLMNEKTMQQNTINQMTMQQQQIEEEHENRFMNQCNIYKKEIKQLKNKVDTLEMNFQSLKNIFKNTMEIWVDEIENEDDLRDNFTIYKNIAKLNELQSTRLNYYIFRYKEIKNITD